MSFGQENMEMELFSVTAVVCGLVVGFSNKLAEVIEHLLPIKQYKVFWKTPSGLPQTMMPKNRRKKFQPSRRHYYRSDVLFAETLLF